MKVSELLESATEFSVVEFSSQKKKFTGSRKECVEWIQNFDKTHSKYVDLRLIDSSGKEDTYWETKPALQRKYKTD